jgi:hypothetical protein
LSITGAGFETPSFTSKVISSQPIGITTPNSSVQYKWAPNVPGDKNLWENVEYHRYGNNIMESHQYVTPATFTVNQFGSAVAHAPVGSSIQMITKVPQIQSINFLDLEDKSTVQETSTEIKSDQDSVFNNFLSSPY